MSLIPSRIRSNTIIVSFSEYPRIVSNAAKVSRFTSIPKSTTAPIAMVTSCNNAITEATAKRHSNLKET